MFVNFQATRDLPNKNQHWQFRCAVDIISYITYPSCQACRLLQILVKWVISDAQITGTIVTSTATWSYIWQHSLHMLMSQNVHCLLESVKCTSLKLRCPSNAQQVKRNGIHLNMSLWYNFPNRCHMIFNTSIIGKGERDVREVLSYNICCLEQFDFQVVQSTPQMLICRHFCLLTEQPILSEVECKVTVMPRIPPFWVFVLHDVISSWFAIHFDPQIIHSNNLSKSHCPSWIRGMWLIRWLGFYGVISRSTFRWWCT